MGGSKTKTTSEQSGKQEITLPQWMTDAGQQIFNKANTFNDKNPVQGYTSPIMGGPHANENAAAMMAINSGGPQQADLASARGLGLAAGTVGGGAPVDYSAEIAKMAGGGAPAGVAGPEYGNARGMIAGATQGGPEQIDPARMWDNGAANEYMNPFVSQVQDQVMRRLEEQKTKDQLNVGDRALAAGGFGGSRHGVLEAESLDDSNQRMQDYLASSSMAGYDNAYNKFAQDQGRKIGVDTTNAGLSENLMARLMQGAGMEAGMAGSEADFDYRQKTDDLARQMQSASGAAAMRGQEAQLNEMLRSGLFSRLLGSSQNMAGIGQAQQGVDTSMMNNLLGTGGQVRGAQNDASMAGYNEFLRMQNAPMDRYAQLSSILGLSPHNRTVTTESTGSQTTRQGGGLFNNLLGAGLTGASLFSDPRLKRDIVELGGGRYSYRYLWEAKGTRHIGVMADEVPAEALGPSLAGFRSVDYSKLEAA